MVYLAKNRPTHNPYNFNRRSVFQEPHCCLGHGAAILMEERKEEAPARRQPPQTWRDRLLLFYGERHLHPAPSGRVAPTPSFAPLAPGSRCEVIVSNDYIVETTKEGGEAHRGRFSDTMLMTREEGAFLRGVVRSYDKDGYVIQYADGPYRRSDTTAPPPGYVPESWWVLSNVALKTSLGDCTFRDVPSSLVTADVALARDDVPKGMLALVTVQLVCSLWWHAYTASAAQKGTRGPNRIIYRLVGPWPFCEDYRPQAYRLLTYQFIHGSWLHLVANALTQLVFGVPMELAHGTFKVLAVHGAGVVAGALTCAVCDSYALVIGASGGAYALMGAHVGAIFKDWDWLKNGVFDRQTRLAVFAAILAADVLQWALTREPGTSYAAHVGGAAAGVLLGVVVLRRRPARNRSDFMRRLGRPAVLAALLLTAALYAFGLAWYAAVYPPRPLSRGWYDAYEFGTRPCCHQAWFCGVAPTDALTCDWGRDGTWALTFEGTVLGGCGAIEAALAGANATNVTM